MTFGKIATVATIAAAIGFGSVSGVIGALVGTGRRAEASKEAPQPAISSPAPLTSEDIRGLRLDITELRKEITDLSSRLGRVEGRTESRR